MRRRFEHFLVLSALPAILAAAAVLLALPSIWTGWQQDDLAHRYFLHGYSDTTGRGEANLAIFTFLDGDTARAHHLMDAGVAPWWTLPGLRLSFWRPLAALSHYLDYLLWPEDPMLMHLQNLVWFAAMIVAGVLLFRRYLGRTLMGGLAGLFFALDDVHGLAAGWIANRNTLLALLAGAIVLILHDRWRRQAWHPGMLAGPGMFAVGLLAGESTLAVCGYLFAYAVFLDNGTLRSRVRSLAPYALIAIVWLIVRALGGHGTWGSGYYVDPLSEPMRFLEAVGMRAPVLLADMLFLPPSSITVFLGEHPFSLLWLWGSAVVILFGILLWPLIRADRLARFWGTGMLLSIPIVCTTLPHTRLLMFAGIGAAGLLAGWLYRVWWADAPADTPARTPSAIRLLAVLVVIVHVPIAAIALAFNATSASFSQKYIQDAVLALEGGPGFHEQDLVIVTHPIPFYGHQFKTARIVYDRVPPRRVRVLAPGGVDVTCERSDSLTLIVRPEGGYLTFAFDNVYRGPAHPMKKGEQVRLTGMTAEVLAVTEDGRPASVAFRFSRPLEDPALRWVRWEGGGYVPFQPPAIGARVSIPATMLVF